MSTNNHLLEILIALSDARVQFIVGGGVALVLQGVERATMDLDISLFLNPKNVDQFLSVVEELGLRPRAPVSGTVLKDPQQITEIVEKKKALVFSFIHPNSPFKQIDVFLAPHLRFEALLPGSEETPLANRKVRILTKEKLLELKKNIQPPRDKDRFDIQMLERLVRHE